MVGDARAALEQLLERSPDAGRCGVGAAARTAAAAWGSEVAALYLSAATVALPAQSEVIGAVNETRASAMWSSARPARCRATCTSCGARDPDRKGYHVEYGYSCMGYEIPGGDRSEDGRSLARGLRHGRRRLISDAARRARHGGRRASPDRRRAGRQPRLRVDRGAVAIGRLAPGSGRTTPASPSTGRAGRTSARRPSGSPIDLAANAASLGARVIRAGASLSCAPRWRAAAGADGPVVVYIEADRYAGVPGFDEVVGGTRRRGLRGATASSARARNTGRHASQRQYLGEA